MTTFTHPSPECLVSFRTILDTDAVGAEEQWTDLAVDDSYLSRSAGPGSARFLVNAAGTVQARIGLAISATRQARDRSQACDGLTKKTSYWLARHNTDSTILSRHSDQMFKMMI